MTESTDIAAPPVTPSHPDHLFADARRACYRASRSGQSIGAWLEGRVAAGSVAAVGVAGLIR